MGLSPLLQKDAAPPGAKRKKGFVFGRIAMINSFYSNGLKSVATIYFVPMEL
jgi:hypothetical protein